MDELEFKVMRDELATALKYCKTLREAELACEIYGDSFRRLKDFLGNEIKESN